MPRGVGLRVAALVALVAMLPFVAGCGVIFGGTRQVVRANSSPEGASISSNPPTADTQTPASISLERKNAYTLTFKKAGYEPAKVELQKHMRGGILVLDILVGLVGVIVDAATGAWYELTPQDATVTLTKIAGNPGADTIQVAIGIVPGKDTARVHVESSEPGVTVEVEAR